MRRFGELWVLDPADEAGFFAARDMGPEPFGPEFTVAYLRAALAGRRAPLKSFLLDQRRIAGVGNIYADEALFRARLHPLRAAGSVGPRQAARLHAALLETLQAGIDHEGSSIESFVDPAGERGGFQEILNVYQRTGEPCRVCGTPIRRVTVGGRGTHFCPRCQPSRGGLATTARRSRAVATPPRTPKPPSFTPPREAVRERGVARAPARCRARGSAREPPLHRRRLGARGARRCASGRSGRRRSSAAGTPTWAARDAGVTPASRATCAPTSRCAGTPTTSSPRTRRPQAWAVDTGLRECSLVDALVDARVATRAVRRIRRRRLPLPRPPPAPRRGAGGAPWRAALAALEARPFRPA